MIEWETSQTPSNDSEALEIELYNQKMMMQTKGEREGRINGVGCNELNGIFVNDLALKPPVFIIGWKLFTEFLELGTQH
jgi:hypothetical protein